MKTQVFFKFKWMFLAGVAFLLPVLGGCQDVGLPEGEVRLSQIQDNPDYKSLPLIGTQWKLIGFVDARRNKIKLAEPAGEDTYLLTFNENGEISGQTSTNKAFGKYLLDDDQLSILEFHNITEINELFDGRYYIETMNNVFSYNLSTKGLALHYDAQKYLLFEPQ